MIFKLRYLSILFLVLAALPAKSEMINGRARVTNIEETIWIFQMGPEILARADHVIYLEILGPVKYAGNKIACGVVDENELELVDGPLKEGDQIAFVAPGPAFTNELLPPVFSNLKDIRLVETHCE